MRKRVKTILILCCLLVIGCFKRTQNEGSRAEDIVYAFDFSTIVTVFVDNHSFCRELSSDEIAYLIDNIKSSRKTGLAKVRCPYSFRIIDDKANEYRFKTNGEEFAAAGTGIFFEFRDNSGWLFEKK